MSGKDSSPIITVGYAVAAGVAYSALAPVFGLPVLAIPTAKIAGLTMIGGSAYFGYKMMRKQEAQTLEDMLRHIYLLGATGSGKTTKILSDIFIPWITGLCTPEMVDKPGAMVIETKDRESVDDLLNSIPEPEHSRVIVFDPYDMLINERFIGLNVLEKNYSLQTVKTLVGGETISIFQRMWDGYIGPSSEDILRNITLANLDQAEQASILEDYQLIKNVEYRELAAKDILNPVLRNYFEKDFPDPGKHQQIFNPPLNKLRSFLTDDLALYILGQRHGIDFRRAMDEGKIFIFCLPKGLIGEPLAKLLASITIAKAQLAAFSRSNIPKGDRLKHPFMVICDEFQDYANASFNAFLEQARSMGVSLVLSHQLIKQRGISQDMIDSILANVGTKYIFACGVNDAPILARELRTAPIGQERKEPFNEWELQHLPNFTCIAKKISKGRRIEPKKETTPVPPARGDWATKLRAESREKYGVPLEEIREDISRRLIPAAQAVEPEAAAEVLEFQQPRKRKRKVRGK